MNINIQLSLPKLQPWFNVKLNSHNIYIQSKHMIKRKKNRKGLSFWPFLVLPHWNRIYFYVFLIYLMAFFINMKNTLNSFLKDKFFVFRVISLPKYSVQNARSVRRCAVGFSGGLTALKDDLLTCTAEFFELGWAENFEYWLNMLKVKIWSSNIIQACRVANSSCFGLKFVNEF